MILMLYFDFIDHFSFSPIRDTTRDGDTTGILPIKCKRNARTAEFHYEIVKYIVLHSIISICMILMLYFDFIDHFSFSPIRDTEGYYFGLGIPPINTQFRSYTRVFLYKMVKYVVLYSIGS